jgi:hypothetical protein
MNRKQRRARAKEIGKDNSQKLADKIFQFDQLPDECLACVKPFDKKSKEHARTWNVVIKDENTVRLYCPECWDTAQKILAKYREDLENEQND